MSYLIEIIVNWALVFLELNKPDGDLETSTDTGYSSNSGGKSRTWTENSKSLDEGLIDFQLNRIYFISRRINGRL